MVVVHISEVLELAKKTLSPLTVCPPARYRLKLGIGRKASEAFGLC